MRKKDHANMQFYKPKKRPPHIRTIEDDFYWIGCILAAAAAAVALISLLWPDLISIKLPPCLFHEISGYYCPGCGGTRAVRALLKGHILLAVYYHPTVPYGAAIYLCFMITQTIERASRRRFCIGMHYRSIYVWTAVALIISSFILKNIMHEYWGFSL